MLERLHPKIEAVLRLYAKKKARPISRCVSYGDIETFAIIDRFYSHTMIENFILFLFIHILLLDSIIRILYVNPLYSSE